MNQELSRQEWDAISAYLDNVLKPRERPRLEKQLQSRPDMQTALQELRQIRYLLRRTPVLKPPRNFTITPEMAGVRSPRARSYPVFRLAFALASILFVMVVVGEFTLGNPAASSVAMAPAAESMPVEEEMMMAEAETMVEEAPAPAQDSAGEPSGERTMVTPEEEGGGETETETMENLQIVEEPSPTEEPASKSPVVTEVVESAPAEAESFAAEPFESPADAAQETAPASSFFNSPWRLLQIIFGAAVLVSGLGLVLLRRKK